jgi:hypothetical protein
MAVGTQQIALCGFGGQPFGRAPPAGANIEGEESAGRIAVMEGQGTQTTRVAATAALSSLVTQQSHFSANALMLLPKVTQRDMPLGFATT